ncbi:MAG: hypothetical protein VYC34_04250 [Planctomycetota bacterium]|nr:hypothetical protein [Planctomycetota bacterium]
MVETLFQKERPSYAGYARVAVERSLDHPEGLTYGIPAGLADLAAGERVRVPLGRGNAALEGFVVEVGVAPDIDPGRIKPIASRMTGRLPASLIELAKWIASYYVCPLGMTLATMLPAAV